MARPRALNATWIDWHCLAMPKLLSQKQLFVVGFLIVSAITGVTAMIISMQRAAAITACQTAITKLTYGMSRQTAYQLNQVDAALTQLQTAMLPAPAPEPQPSNAVLRSPAATGLLADQFNRLLNVDSLFLADAGGQIVNRSGSWPAAPVDVSGQDYFRHFKREDDPALFAGQPVRNPVSGLWTEPLARRIDGPQGSFAGVAVAELSLTDLAAFYQLAMPPGRIVYLARDDGVVLLGYPARMAQTGRRIPQTSPWYALVAHGGGNYDAPAYFSPAPVIATVRPLPGLPFVVETSVTEAEALQQWQQQRLWLLAGGAFSVLFALSLLRLFRVQFKRIQAAKRILAAKNAELDVARRQLEATLANLSQGVCFFDENNKLLVFNQRYCQLIGLPSGTIRAGISITEITELRIAHGHFRDQSPAEYFAILQARISAGMPFDETCQLTDGRTLSKHYEPLAGHGWVMTVEDISERRAAEQKIAYLAHHDLLTGLANRALFREQLRQAFTGTAPGKSFAMLCLDLDRFKAVNDTFGHPVGDSLLLAVADRLRTEVRAGDTIARMGGDEFVILQLNVSDKAETIALARRIIEAINQPFSIAGHVLGIGVSIGIAMAPSERPNPERLFQDADLALYRSKQSGRGTWRIFDPTMDVDANGADTNASSAAAADLHHSLVEGSG